MAVFLRMSMENKPLRRHFLASFYFFTPSQARKKEREKREKNWLTFLCKNGGDEERKFSQMVAESSGGMSKMLGEVRYEHIKTFLQHEKLQKLNVYRRRLRKMKLFQSKAFFKIRQ